MELRGAVDIADVGPDATAAATVAGGGELAVLEWAAPVREPPPGLTAAERSVVALALDGLANGEIARRRGTREHTVANQMARVFRKLGVCSRQELFARVAGPSVHVANVRLLAEERRRSGLEPSDRVLAAELWAGVVEGRWSVVDRWDADGRRCLLARRNEPGASDRGAITARERRVAAFAALGHSNRTIGRALGLAPSTVGGLLTTVRRKLRLGSRREIIEAFAAAPPPEA